MAEGDKSLAEVRRRIDEVDDSIHDLLIERTALVERARAAKGNGNEGYFRPAREAAVLRRLIGRHQGRFPKTVLVRVWREIMSAMLRLQGPYSVAVYAPEGLHWYWDHAREHFGASMPTSGFQSARGVVIAVSDGSVSAGVLPLPAENEETPWWPTLAVQGGPRIVARIPFSSGGSGPGDSAGALVIGGAKQEPTGYDRSFLYLRAGEDVSRARLTEILTKAGMPPLYLLPSVDDTDPESTLHLAEIDDYVAEDDSRIAALLDNEDPMPVAITVLGGYAVPFAANDLAANPKDAQDPGP